MKITDVRSAVIVLRRKRLCGLDFEGMRAALARGYVPADIDGVSVADE